MKFFIKIYLKLINNFWKIIIFKLIKFILSSINFEAVGNICVNMLNGAELLSLNFIIILILSSSSFYVHYLLYIRDVDDVAAGATVLKDSYAALARYNLYIENYEGEVNENIKRNRSNIITRVRAFESLHKAVKASLYYSGYSMVIYGSLFSIAFVGLPLSYNSDKVCTAYNVAKSWSSALKLKESNLLFFKKHFKDGII